MRVFCARRWSLERRCPGYAETSRPSSLIAPRGELAAGREKQRIGMTELQAVLAQLDPTDGT